MLMSGLLIGAGVSLIITLVLEHVLKITPRMNINKTIKIKASRDVLNLF